METEQTTLSATLTHAQSVPMAYPRDWLPLAGFGSIPTGLSQAITTTITTANHELSTSNHTVSQTSIYDKARIKSRLLVLARDADEVTKFTTRLG